MNARKVFWQIVARTPFRKLNPKPGFDWILLCNATRHGSLVRLSLTIRVATALQVSPH